MKDHGQRRCGYSNLGKIVIKSVAAKRVAATNTSVRIRTGLRDQPTHWAQLFISVNDSWALV
jgi:hypothetical protein